MSVPFNPNSGLIVVEAILEGPTGITKRSFVLDTGSRVTVVRDSVLLLVGYNPATLPRNVRMTTASGMVQVARLPVTRLSSLGHDKLAFPVVAHTLPPTAPYDGLLGLDFIRGMILNIDFRAGLIELL
jgi:predicted aspartyl protease